jgi:methanethiol S-methyltransferase
MWRRILVLLYGLFAYSWFLGVIVYAMGFEANVLVPKGIDDGRPSESVLVAAGINVGLLLLFGVQHTIMARGGFKRFLVRYVPAAAERSTFVLAASLLLALVFWQWRPIPGVVWAVEHPLARLSLMAGSLAGWGIVFYTSFLIDHFELFGLRQVWLHFRGRSYHPPQFVQCSLYNHVRHPLMLGFLIAFWVTPVMTVGHLVFSLTITAYVLFGVAMEERDLVRAHGLQYERYRRTTPMLIPWRRRPVETPPVSAAELSGDRGV